MSPELHREILGQPDAIVPRQQKAAARCQAAVDAALSRYLTTLASATLAEKKSSLAGKDGTPALLSSELGDDLAAVPLASKTMRAFAKLIETTIRKCDQLDLAELFPGPCAPDGADPVEFATCLSRLARCGHCLAVASADHLSASCLPYSGLGGCGSDSDVAALAFDRTPTCAETFTVQLDVTNSGNAPTAAAGIVQLTDELSADGSIQATTVGGFPVLVPGQVFRVNLPLTLGAHHSEIHIIRITLDPAGVLADVSRSNNRDSSSFVLQRGTCPLSM